MCVCVCVVIWKAQSKWNKIDEQTKIQLTFDIGFVLYMVKIQHNEEWWWWRRWKKKKKRRETTWTNDKGNICFLFLEVFSCLSSMSPNAYEIRAQIHNMARPYQFNSSSFDEFRLPYMKYWNTQSPHTKHSVHSGWNKSCVCERERRRENEEYSKIFIFYIALCVVQQTNHSCQNTFYYYNVYDTKGEIE